MSGPRYPVDLGDELEEIEEDIEEEIEENQEDETSRLVEGDLSQNLQTEGADPTGAAPLLSSVPSTTTSSSSQEPLPLRPPPRSLGPPRLLPRPTHPSRTRITRRTLTNVELQHAVTPAQEEYLDKPRGWIIFLGVVAAIISLVGLILLGVNLEKSSSYHGQSGPGLYPSPGAEYYHRSSGSKQAAYYTLLFGVALAFGFLLLILFPPNNRPHKMDFPFHSRAVREDELNRELRRPFEESPLSSSHEQQRPLPPYLLNSLSAPNEVELAALNQTTVIPSTSSFVSIQDSPSQTSSSLPDVGSSGS